jgi:hypothetical protein
LKGDYSKMGVSFSALLFVGIPVPYEYFYTKSGLRHCPKHSLRHHLGKFCPDCGKETIANLVPTKAFLKVVGEKDHQEVWDTLWGAGPGDFGLYSNDGGREDSKRLLLGLYIGRARPNWDTHRAEEGSPVELDITSLAIAIQNAEKILEAIYKLSGTPKVYLIAHGS